MVSGRLNLSTATDFYRQALFIFAAGNLKIITLYLPRILFYLFLITLVTSCRAFRPVTDTPARSQRVIEENSLKAAEQPEIVNTISSSEQKRAIRDIHNKPGPTSSFQLTPGSLSEQQIRYNLLLDREVETPLHPSLFRFINDWIGTPYKVGGMSKAGIDCSGFAFTLFITVYDIELPRTAYEQRRFCNSVVEKPDLQEGDLVFFNTRGGTSHVGCYLGNNKFVHAATTGGVMISDLNEAYWRNRYLGAGRVVR